MLIMNDVAIQHTAGVLGLSRLDPQETKFIEELLRGVPLVPAAKSAGIKNKDAHEVAARPHVAQTLAYLRDQYAREVVRVDRDMLNMMLLEAHGKAGTATEEIMAIRELGKMNGCYEPEKREVAVNKTMTYEQVQRLDTDELLRLAEEDSQELEPLPGEWETHSNE